MLVALSMSLSESRQIEFRNNCGKDIWVNPLTNAQGPGLPGGIARIGNGGSYTYQIPNGGW